MFRRFSLGFAVALMACPAVALEQNTVLALHRMGEVIAATHLCASVEANQSAVQTDLQLNGVDPSQQNQLAIALAFRSTTEGEWKGRSQEDACNFFLTRYGPGGSEGINFLREK
jgi:hypothetical protein